MLRVEVPKRSRSVSEGVVVYDDDIDYPAFCRKRNVETMDGYDEYCTLWRDFIDLKTEVRWRNKFIPKSDPKVIPRIQALIEESREDDKKLEDTRDRLQKEILAENTKLQTAISNNDVSQKEDSEKRIVNLNTTLLKTPKPKKLEYQYYEAHHISIWEQMEKLIEKLADNAYVKNRNDNDPNKLEDYKMALYDMIEK
jgi:hypothetical protein